MFGASPFGALPFGVPVGFPAATKSVVVADESHLTVGDGMSRSDIAY